MDECGCRAVCRNWRGNEKAKKQQQEQRALEVERLKKGFGIPRSNYVESNYIKWVDPHNPINQGKLGSSQGLRIDKKNN